MSEKDEIILRGLQENNLKNINLNIPKRKIIAVTGKGKQKANDDELPTLREESDASL